jgi:hypothetical protein
LRFTLPARATAPAQHSGGLTLIGSETIDPVALARLTTAELVLLRKFLEGQTRSLPARGRFAAAFPGLSLEETPDQEFGPCAEAKFGIIPTLLARRGLLALDADPSDPDQLPDPQGSWESFFTANIEVVYTTDSVNLPDHALTGAAAQLPQPVGAATEVPFTLNLGTPDEIHLGQTSTSLSFLNAGLTGSPNLAVPPERVQRIALLAEYALAQYRGALFGLRDPQSAGQRIKYRIFQIYFNGRMWAGATRPEWDHVRIHPHISNSQVIGTVPHELFHRVQYQYNNTTDPSVGMYSAVREGGARFAEECLNDVPNHYIQESDPIFNFPGRSIEAFTDSSGKAFEQFDYEAGIFWKYLGE